MARCILHIDLNASFVFGEQLLNPKLNGEPVIADEDPERRRRAAPGSGALDRLRGQYVKQFQTANNHGHGYGRQQQAKYPGNCL